jgi:hypothetical protein
MTQDTVATPGPVVNPVAVPAAEVARGLGVDPAQGLSVAEAASRLA